MHGLIFETSICLHAGSTRYLLSDPLSRPSSTRVRTSAHFHDVGVHYHFSVSRSIVAQQTAFSSIRVLFDLVEPTNGITLISQSRTSQVRSPFSRCRKQRSPTFIEDYQYPNDTLEKHTHRHGGSPSG